MKIAAKLLLMSTFLAKTQIYCRFLIVVVMAFFKKLKKLTHHEPKRSNELPYIRNPELFSPTERSILSALEQAVGENFRIFGKVRLADVVDIRAMNDRSAWQDAVNRIAAERFDFILCNKDDLAIRCAVDLHDPSPESPRRRQRDAFLKDLCGTIALPLVQIQGRRQYSSGELRKIFLPALNTDSGTKIMEPEPDFSVGLLADAPHDERPWTIA